MLDQTEVTLAGAGYGQYEISNYARGGAVCEHNVRIWRGGDYLGLGPGASSRVGRYRWTHAAQLASWAAASCEALDSATDVTERLMFAFRLNEGVDLSAFGARFGCSSSQIEEWERECAEMAAEGALVRDGLGWRLTRRGRRVADSVAARLLG